MIVCAVCEYVVVVFQLYKSTQKASRRLEDNLSFKIFFDVDSKSIIVNLVRFDRKFV